MIRQSLVSGIITGLLLSIGLIYPAFMLIIARPNPDWFGIVSPDRSSATSLMVSLVICAIALVLIGAYPALRLNATNSRDGAKAGTLSGIVAGVVVFFVVLSPVNAWQATVPLFAYPPGGDVLLPPEAVLSEFLQRIFVYAFVRLLPILLGGGAIVGWFIGGLTGAVRRNRQPDRPLALIDVVDQRRGQRRWFTCCDDSGRAGLIAGLLCGGLLIFATLSNTYSGLTAQAPQLGVAGTQCVIRRTRCAPTLQRRSRQRALAARRHHHDRVQRVRDLDPARSATALPLTRQRVDHRRESRRPRALLQRRTRDQHDDWPRGYSGSGIMPPDGAGAKSLLDRITGDHRARLFYAAIDRGLRAIGLSMSTIGAAQGILYGVLISLVLRRPVDRAANLRFQLREAPDQFLPQIYSLYNTRADAARILPHLAFDLRRRQPDMARVIAAHHLATTDSERAAEAVPVINTALNAQRSGAGTWNWALCIACWMRVCARARWSKWPTSSRCRKRRPRRCRRCWHAPAKQ